MNAGELFAERLGLTLFDLLVLTTIGLLLFVIGLTAVFGIRDERDYVIYLQRDTRNVYDLWIAPVEEPDQARPITQTDSGVWEYDVSPDGQLVVYTEMNFQVGARDLYVLDLASGETSQLTSCQTQDADCYGPRFRPDGSAIAYERAALNASTDTLGIGAARVWLLDLTTTPPTTFPVIDPGTTTDNVIGTGPVWSANSERLAFYNNNGGEVIVYNFATGDVDRVPAELGLTGSLSPDGSQLIYPTLVQQRGNLQWVDLETDLGRVLSDPGDMADEQYTAWSPDERYVAVGRRPADMRGTQIYLYDLEQSRLLPLLVDGRFNHSSFRWNEAGNQLVMTRFQQLTTEGDFYTEGTLEIWTFDVESGELTQITDGASLNPQWITPPRSFATVDLAAMPTPRPTLDPSF
jgi:Tol biopolymer transport system component